MTVPPSTTTADLMYTLTVDLNNHYRIWVEGWLLRFERKTTAMGKEAIGGVVTFSATNHTYWRIRHDTVWDNMVFETAPKVSGAPGACTRECPRSLFQSEPPIDVHRPNVAPIDLVELHPGVHVVLHLSGHPRGNRVSLLSIRPGQRRLGSRLSVLVADSISSFFA